MRRPDSRVGAIGTSLGGASIVFAQRPSGFDAVVLEAVYSDARQAIRNRLAIRFGTIASLIEPLLGLQIGPRLGIDADALRPIDRIAQLDAPVFVIGGEDDRHTVASETRGMYASARRPKQLWVVTGARHQDILRYAPDEYSTRVGRFLDTYLSGPAEKRGAR